MPRHVHLDRVLALIDIALQSGGRRVSLMRVEWDISGDCLNSYPHELYGRADLEHGKRWATIIPLKQNTPQLLLIRTRCRKCERCLRMRQRRWYGAAIREVKQSSRTWFGTLTLSPENHHVALSRARAKLARQGTDFDALTAHEQFVARHVEIGNDLTKYIKRVRKNSDARLRYLLVAEAHKSGLPHYHMLVHERPLAGTVAHRILSKQWTLGFEKWRLVDQAKADASPAYVSKGLSGYLAKSLSARVRASQGYGGAYSELHAYVSQELQRLREEGGKRSEPLPSLIDPLFASLYE